MEALLRLRPIDQCSACLRILLSLYFDGENGKEDLRQEAEVSQDALNHSLRILLDLALVEEHSEQQFPFRKLISLTDRGRLLVESPLAKWGRILD